MVQRRSKLVARGDVRIWLRTSLEQGSHHLVIPAPNSCRKARTVRGKPFRGVKPSSRLSYQPQLLADRSPGLRHPRPPRAPVGH